MSDIFGKELFPLSLSQLNILNLERVLAGTSVNNISTTVRIKGRVDLALLQQSINRIIESDSSLRTRLVNIDGEMMQYHAPFIREEFPVYDFSNTGEDGLKNWENAVTRELIPLEDGPLYRFILFRDSETGGGILVKLHHIIADGWSQIMLCNKIGKTYIELLSGKEPAIEEAPDYRLHIREEQDYLNSKTFSRDENYWKSIVEKIGEPSSFKTAGGASTSPVGRRMSFELPQIINHAIFSFCQEKRVAPFAVFYMALAIYFKRNSGADRFTIGVPIFNRTSYEFKQSTGMFVTTLPFFNELNDEWTLNTFNEELMNNWYEMLRHQRYPFSKICELAQRDGRLFNIALSYQDSKIYESRDASVLFSGRWHYCGYQAEQLTIHLTNLKDHQQYAVDYDYLAQYFTENEIASLHRDLCHILSEALSEPDKPIYRLNVLSFEEKEQVLYAFNKTDKYLEECSVYQALLKKSNQHLNRAAVIHNGERMSYGALLHRSTQFAYAINKNTQKPNSLIAIMLPRNFDLPAAMIGALQQEYAYLLLSDTTPSERIKTILAQSEAAVLITDEKGKTRLGECNIPIITPDAADECYSFPAENKSLGDETPVGDKLAYVVYTSGSTGEPKGVEITQRNLLNLAQEMETVYGQDAVLSVCNVGFDAFMLESIVALINGRTIVFPTDRELESPESLARLMNGYAVGFLSMTPSRLNAFLSNSTFKKAMRRMESIICGGEHFPAELLKKLKIYTNARIYNQYGPSETTVAVSMKELSRADKITAGTPMGNCKMYVLDRWMNPLPIGGTGKLFIGGKCVGNGYRNRPDLTEQVFRPNPFLSEGKLYDTGDIAYWTPNGEIVLSGRADRQVKLNGLRIELQEVSSCVESFAGVISAFARICAVNGTEILGVYYCSDKEISEPELIAHAATYLPQYMIPAFFMRVDALPITANGKIDEKALPLPTAESSEPCEGMSSYTQKVLDIFRHVLNNNDIHANSDYFLSGGNSLNAMQCVMEIEEKLSKKIRIADIYACRTAARLSAFLSGETQLKNAPEPEKPKAALSLVKSEKKSEYPLTAVQQGMYIQSVLDPNGCAYNMPGAFKLEEAPDIKKLENAFITLIKEDAIFRTVFVQGDNAVVSKILKNAEFALEILDADSFEAATRMFLKPFDLSKAPLLRAALWQSKSGEWYLFIDSHHIIGDGMSTPLILQRLDKAYNEENVNVEWDFYDYLNTLEASDAKEKNTEYWANHLSNLPEQLQLPGDFPRPKKFDYKGKETEILFSLSESKACAAYCKDNGISEYVLFLTAYGILLSAISGKNDFIIGAPVAGRNIINTDKVCGPLINTLPLRFKIDKQNTIEELLAHVRAEVTEMLDHQQITLEEIINALNLPHGEQNALYQVMMTQSPVDEASFTLGGGKMTYHPIFTGSVKMDMIAELKRKNDQYAICFSYATGLFLPETVSFYGRCIKQIISELIKGGERKVNEITMLPASDREMLIDAPNRSVTPFLNRPIHKILQSTAATKCDETAVIYHGEKITFSEIEKRASKIADFIDSKHLKEGQCVALCLKRTPDMIAAMYGVLKAGCAYMFMLDSFPEARLRYMVDISSAGLVLHDGSVNLPESFKNGEIGVEVCMLPEGYSIDNRKDTVNDDRLVNVLFTSGSTGEPKGVMLRHRSVSNLYSQMQSLLAPIEGTVLCSTNSIFDCFIVETLIALALGRTVVLADEEEMMLPWKLASLVETYRTGIFEMTPARLNMCLGNEAFCNAAKYIRIVLLGGEVVTDTLMNKFYEHSDGILMNMYGPTEATVFTTMEPLKKGEHITIGRPLQNTRTYVLDEDMNPVLPTACGEMYIAGECLSKGYIGREELTNALFVDDIFFQGEKMYRSGDLVRLRLDGRFDYIGRKDAQVKFNGQRVELSEITGAIENIGGVFQAATVALRKDDATMELCSFFTSDNDKLTDNNIMEEIRKVLPKYMIPSRIIRLDKMPMTATNKIDGMTLKKYASEGVNHLESIGAETKKAKPVTAPDVIDADYILSVWNTVLSVSATSPNSSFFEQGGTSMAALTVLSRYYNDHIEMSLSEFYENPTAEMQANLIRSKNGIAPIAEQAEKRALISGATGFFGAHLLYELTLNDNKKVTCIMRDGSLDRLADTLHFYFGEEKERILKNITVVKADISEDNLGMSESDYDTLCKCTSEIYHCAADVSHYALDPQKYMKTNVGGTENMLEVAKRSGATFYHMSTCSVSGDALKDSKADAEFTENDFDIGQNWAGNIYVKSKFLAEKAVFEAIENGVDAKIFRLGRLVGRASDGKFQKNPETNTFYLLMMGFTKLGAIPAEAANQRIDLMPIDTSVKEVLALRNSENRVFHIMNSAPPTVQEVIPVLDKHIKAVNNIEFYNILQDRNADIDGALCGIIIDYLFKASKGSKIHVTNIITTEALEKSGYCPDALCLETVLNEFWKGEQ